MPATPSIIVISYQPRPDGHAAWLAAMQQLAQQARALRACRHFQLCADRRDSSHYLVLSVWEDRTAFDRFVREVGLLWLERALALPAAYHFLESLPPDLEDTPPQREHLAVGAS